MLVMAFCLMPAIYLSPDTVLAQTAPTEGMKENTARVHAFIEAEIILSPGNRISNGTLVIRDGVIEAAGENVSVPADARIWNIQGKTIYPGFIDAYTTAGMGKSDREVNQGNISWNPNIRAQLSAAAEYLEDEEEVAELRGQGFTAVLTAPPLGIFRGSAALVSLNDREVAGKVVKENIVQTSGFRRSPGLGFSYPTSALGVYALMRQTLYDAEWHREAHQAYQENPSLERPELNSALLALNEVITGEQPLLIETSGAEEILRAYSLSEEFDIPLWIVGNGHEYQILDVLREKQFPMIIPVALPEKPDLDTPEKSMNVSLADLRHYYLAPENPGRLEKEGIRFSLTSRGLDNKSNFLKRLRGAVDAGLSSDMALRALTTHPAELLGVSDSHGTLEPGKTANLIVADGDLFESNAKILDVWVDGSRFAVNKERRTDFAGTWTVSVSDGSASGRLELEEKSSGGAAGSVTLNGIRTELRSVTLQDGASRIRADFRGDRYDLEGLIRVTASISGDEITGWAEVPGQGRLQWTGRRSSAAERVEDSARTGVNRNLTLSNIRPSMEYGRESMPEKPETILIRNATLWTMGEDGILENGDLLIRNGKVAATGTGLNAPGDALVINAEGKHVTPGLIDAHLHSGVAGVNEIGNAITAEVRIGDVLTLNNIWMYRQLAGGLTTAHVMHGSANPIGGQNQHIKMKWGALPEDLKIEDAPVTVKFALGENPKRVGTDRYPETRMGVEQIIADRFSMARDYETRWNEWERNRQGIPPRRDLRMDALRDILNGDIIVQSHSYRQDEILMLMRLAEEYRFRIGAFHHGVEAYKVANELAEHGAGAVVWSDWSSFKIEAQDGILYNARLLSEAGVLTSLHSDDSQIATRMNWEAAKMVRAGMDPEDALALVTINTAKILGIDHRTGSLEEGKDGDFVIWRGNPLSITTKVEQTWIEGQKFFDLREDRTLQQRIQKERSELINWILEEGYE